MGRFSARSRRWNSSGIGGFHTFLVVVVGHHEGDRAAAVADPGDDGRQHVGEFGADDQEPFGVGLGRGDLQQRDELAGGGQPVLDEAVMGQLGQLLDPDAGVAQDFHGRPGPERRGALRGSGRGACPWRGPRPRSGRWPWATARPGAVSCPPAVNARQAGQPRQAASRAAGLRRSAAADLSSTGRTGRRSRVRWSIRALRRDTLLGVRDLFGADRARRGPLPPPGRVVGGPLGDVEVERAHREQGAGRACPRHRLRGTVCSGRCPSPVCG